MPRLRRWLPRVFFESALIVVSILTALAVNGWREARGQQRRVEEACMLFREEIGQNRALLVSETILPHHRRLWSVYRNLAVAGAGEGHGALWETGVHPALLRDAAWRSLSSSGIFGHLPYREVVLLADIYSLQEMLSTIHSTKLATLGAPRSDRESPAYIRDEIRVIQMYLADVVFAEQELLRLYELALERLGVHAPQSAGQAGRDAPAQGPRSPP